MLLKATELAFTIEECFYAADVVLLWFFKRNPGISFSSLSCGFILAIPGQFGILETPETFEIGRLPLYDNIRRYSFHHKIECRPFYRIL